MDKMKAMTILEIPTKKNEVAGLGMDGTYARDEQAALEKAKIILGINEDKKADRTPKYTREQAKDILGL